MEFGTSLSQPPLDCGQVDRTDVVVHRTEVEMGAVFTASDVAFDSGGKVDHVCAQQIARTLHVWLRGVVDDLQLDEISLVLDESEPLEFEQQRIVTPFLSDRFDEFSELARCALVGEELGIA
jgi:hypothetical protein